MKMSYLRLIETKIITFRISKGKKNKAFEGGHFKFMERYLKL